MNTSAKLKKNFRALVSRPTDQFMELGKCLAALSAVMPGDQFKAMLDSAGLGKRKAYYLINIAEELRCYTRYRARLQKLGWTKCQMIAAQLSEADFQDLLSFAETHTAKDLENYARRGDLNASVRTRCVLLYFSQTQYRQYEEALLKFGAIKRGRGMTGKEVATVKMAKKVMQAR